MSDLGFENDQLQAPSWNSVRQTHSVQSAVQATAPNFGWRSQSSSLNDSDLIDEKTLDFRNSAARSSQGQQHLFEPSEITGRSTGHDFLNQRGRPEPDDEDDLDVEAILSQSASDEVRKLAFELNQMKVRQSYGGRTADMSLPSGASRNCSMAASDVWGGGTSRNVAEMRRQLDETESSFQSNNVSGFFVLS